MLPAWLGHTFGGLLAQGYAALLLLAPMLCVLLSYSALLKAVNNQSWLWLQGIHIRYNTAAVHPSKHRASHPAQSSAAALADHVPGDHCTLQAAGACKAGGVQDSGAAADRPPPDHTGNCRHHRVLQCGRWLCVCEELLLMAYLLWKWVGSNGCSDSLPHHAAALL